MKPPLIVMAHYDPRELVWCEDCRRLSNSATQCNACGASCGLVGLPELLRNGQPTHQDGSGRIRRDADSLGDVWEVSVKYDNLQSRCNPDQTPQRRIASD
jgi:hypothetical protein